MTRYPPQAPPQDGYGSNESYGYQQPRYGGNEPEYGTYSSGEGQGNYGQNQPRYGGEDAGNAQSYYASNEQAYQQYTQAPYSGYGAQQYPPASTGAPPYQQSPPPPMQQPPYASGYPPQEYPPYGQQYPSQPNYGSYAGDETAAFRSHYEQPHGSINPNTDQPPAPGAEDERGIMGALAGGAAGAYGGHKVHHGFLGGIGGAVAGSMLEDAYKKHHKEEEMRKHEAAAAAAAANQHYHSPSGPVMAGNFHASSRDVRLEGHCTLVAECADERGHHHQTSLDLNDCLTNTSGRLCWARGGNFAASSRNIRLTDGGNALEAELGDGRGGWEHNKIWLGERITNDNGRLEMI